MSSTTYAIIKTGGKQYRVAEDDVIDVELLGAEPGSKVEFSEVLFLSDGKNTHVGTPSVDGSTVKGELIEIVKSAKITSVKYKKRKNCRKKWGHRQDYARVKITTISSAKSKANTKAKEKTEAEG